MFSAFPLLLHTDTVTGCVVLMLQCLHTKWEKLSHLVQSFQEGVGSSRASAQHIQQSPGLCSYTGNAAAHPAWHCSIIGDSREGARMTGVDDGWKTDLVTPLPAPPPPPLPSPLSPQWSTQGGERVFRGEKKYQVQVPAITAGTEIPPDHKPQRFIMRVVRAME